MTAFEKAVLIATAQREKAQAWAQSHPRVLVDDDAPVVDGRTGTVLVAAWIEIDDSIDFREGVLNAG